MPDNSKSISERRRSWNGEIALIMMHKNELDVEISTVFENLEKRSWLKIEVKKIDLVRGG